MYIYCNLYFFLKKKDKTSSCGPKGQNIFNPLVAFKPHKNIRQFFFLFFSSFLCFFFSFLHSFFFISTRDSSSSFSLARPALLSAILQLFHFDPRSSFLPAIFSPVSSLLRPTSSHKSRTPRASPYHHRQSSGKAMHAQ